MMMHVVPNAVRHVTFATWRKKKMSKPLGSKCCDWEVEQTDEWNATDSYYVFICCNCGEKCEVVE